MALVRALNSAISGLKSFQFSIDNIGNNLANIYTTGYKESRVNFGTLFSQTLSYGTSPQGNLGGIDPQQIGLGVQVGGVTKNFSQGGLKVTGIKTDLAIEGDGFFVLKGVDGSLIFSRDGSFTINPQGMLHNPVTGEMVQGYQANFDDFQIISGGPLSNLEIPIGKLTIAKATSNIELSGNLNGGGKVSDSGAVLISGRLVDASTGNAATLNTLLTDLERQGPAGVIDLNLENGDVIELKYMKGNSKFTSRFQISPNPPVPGSGIDRTGQTLGDFIEFIRAAIGINNNIAGMYSAPVTNGYLQAGETMDANGYTALPTVNFEALGVEPGDFIRITTGAGAGQVARIQTVNANQLTFDPNFTFDPTIPLPSATDEWVINERARVSLGTGGALPANQDLEDKYTSAGVIRISGNVGSINDISNLTLSKMGGDEITVFNKIASASGESFALNTTVYDSLGKAHVLSLAFALMSKSSLDLQRGNKFIWFAETDDNYDNDRVAGNGFLQFNTSGKYMSQNPVNGISINLSNSGASTPLLINADMSRLTCFSDSNSEVAMTNQDGYEKGILNDFAIGNDGIITGIFSNGITKPLGQIVLARVDNPNGLIDLGNNSFKVGPNSGLANIGEPGSFARGTIRSGALEESNVDMAKSFTDLIVSQRAFQANAKTINVANEMLRDLIAIGT